MSVVLEQISVGEPDDDLIELIGMKDEFPAEARDAYGKIYQSYWKLMYYIALKITKEQHEAEDLVADTFMVLYNKAHTFKRGKIRNPENVRLSIQKWLTTIMQHIFYDHYLDDAYKETRANGGIEETYLIESPVVKYLQDDYDAFIDGLEREEMDEVSNELQGEDSVSGNELKIRAYLDTLPDRERDIILAIYNFHIPGKYTPPEVLDELEIKWQTTRDNIRKILQKFRKTINEELKNHLIIRK